jgi:hypothetical protein
MNDLRVSGSVILVEPTQSFGSNGFKKRTVVLEQDSGKYINVIPVEFVNDDCEKADAIKIGSTIEVKFYLNGRAWQKDAQSDKRYFVTLRAADYRVLEDAKQAAATPEQEGTYNSADVPF